MPRQRRLIMPGFPHHITHRGNRRAPVFRDDADRRFYLSRLLHYSRLYDLRLYAYSLMSNHVHYVAVPPTRQAVSNCLHDLHGTYAAYFNRKYGFDGHLWQERFFACVLGDTHLWNAVRYVERNPVEARLVEHAEEYLWSSARAHCGLTIDPALDPRFPPPGLIPDWRLWLAEQLSVDELAAIRTATRRGVPYATESFIRELERLTGSRFPPRRRGRPTKSSENTEV